MSSKFIASILVLFVAGIVCLCNAQVQELIIAKPVIIPSADSTTKKVIDSTKIIRDEFVAQKEILRDKVDFLQEQQKQIKETQRQIDSFTLATVIQNTRTIESFP